MDGACVCVCVFVCALQQMHWLVAHSCSEMRVQDSIGASWSGKLGAHVHRALARQMQFAPLTICNACA